MDPTETLATLLESLRLCARESANPGDPHRRNAIRSLRHLAEWMAKSGFPPDVDDAIETYRDRTERGEGAS